MKERKHLIIWLVTKTLFLYFCFPIGQWLYAKVGPGGLMVFAFAVFLTQLFDFYNQYIITKAQRLLKEQIEESSLSPADTERNLAQIKHLALSSSSSGIFLIDLFLKRAGSILLEKRTGRNASYPLIKYFK